MMGSKRKKGPGPFLAKGARYLLVKYFSKRGLTPF